MRKLTVLLLLSVPFLVLAPPTDLLLSLVHNLPSLFVAIFIVNARKANFDIKTFLDEFQNVGQQQKAVVSISVMAAFLARIFFLNEKEDLRPFLLQTASALIAIGLFDILK